MKSLADLTLSGSTSMLASLSTAPQAKATLFCLKEMAHDKAMAAGMDMGAPAASPPPPPGAAFAPAALKVRGKPRRRAAHGE